MRKSAVFTAAVAATLLGITAGPASASQTAEPPAGCWGHLSQELARSGGMGDHASSFAGYPRTGLANVVPGGISALCDLLG